MESEDTVVGSAIWPHGAIGTADRIEGGI